MTILLFILLLTFLILIHELGHFFVARFCKVHIEEFGIGLPPKAFTLFHWRGTPFTINWLFLGGFVRMEGENGEEEIHAKATKIKPHAEYPFYQRPLLQKLAIVVAGPLVNFLFGVIVLTGLFSMYGVPTEIHAVPVLKAVVADSPAQQVGLVTGDQITGIKTPESGSFTTTDTNEQIIDFVGAHKGEDITLKVIREKEEKMVSVHIRKTEETPDGQGALGIEFEPQMIAKKYPLWQLPFIGFQKGVEFGVTILKSLGDIGKTIGEGKVPQGVAGPVGIAREVQKQNLFSNPPLMFNFAALLSINLGIMNMLPIPALDGGRAVLLILEKFLKGKRWTELSNMLNTVGFVLLISLLILITIKDVANIFF
ncbi:MAG: M50 family metallopeptidase [Candidatus Woesebacteria bacterium]